MESGKARPGSLTWGFTELRRELIPEALINRPYLFVEVLGEVVPPCQALERRGRRGQDADVLSVQEESCLVASIVRRDLRPGRVL
ncbi:hypothetical protein ACFUTV_41870 [Streptomyces sp. NPDC057298]|uniref:hypothetical protein n=1 Tax=Streptomyces sp. NPDC057298 TaxID=3346091 RepID=UPI00363DDB8A